MRREAIVSAAAPWLTQNKQRNKKTQRSGMPFVREGYFRLGITARAENTMCKKTNHSVWSRIKAKPLMFYIRLDYQKSL